MFFPEHIRSDPAVVAEQSGKIPVIRITYHFNYLIYLEPFVKKQLFGFAHSYSGQIIKKSLAITWVNHSSRCRRDPLQAM